MREGRVAHLQERDAIVHQHAAPGAEVIIVDPDRGNRNAFCREMAILGYALSLAVLPRKAGAPVAVANPVNAAAPAHSTGPAELQLA